MSIFLFPGQVKDLEQGFVCSSSNLDTPWTTEFYDYDWSQVGETFQFYFHELSCHR